jgi:hypothetical protein
MVIDKGFVGCILVSPQAFLSVPRNDDTFYVSAFAEGVFFFPFPCGFIGAGVMRASVFFCRQYFIAFGGADRADSPVS